MPLLIVGAGFLFLLVVAVGGYFFVYPRLRGTEPGPVAAVQPDESAAAGEIPAPVAESDPSGPAASTTESESAGLEPAVDREPQTAEEQPETATEQTGSIGQVPEAVVAKPARTPTTRRDEPRVARTPSRSTPEPVSSPDVTHPEEPQSSSQPEPTAVEPAFETADRSPSPSEETQAGTTVPDRQPSGSEKPAYQGPKRGVVIWSGEVDKGTTVVIDGTSATVGQVQGALPGVACMVRLSAPNVAVTEGPGPRNGYRRISLRFNKKGRFSVPVEWEVLH